MVRFIFGCAFVLGLSILAIPVYYGVAENKATVTASAEDTNNTLTFEEIYEVAGDNQAGGQEIDPGALNAIEAAAGGQEKDAFTTGFTGVEDTALQDTPAPIEAMIEDETTTE